MKLLRALGAVRSLQFTSSVLQGVRSLQATCGVGLVTICRQGHFATLLHSER